MKRNTPNHPKVRRLGRRVGGQLIAIGVLEALWHFVAQFAPTGDVGRYQDEDIADGVFWGEEPARLIDALVDSGWLERSETHRLIVHDWPDHCEDAVHLFLARNVLLFADGTMPRFSRLSKTERPAIEQGFKQLLQEVSYVNAADAACDSALCAQETQESAARRTACTQETQQGAEKHTADTDTNVDTCANTNTDANTPKAPRSAQHKRKGARSAAPTHVGEVDIGGLTSAIGKRDGPAALAARAVALTGERAWLQWWRKVFSEYEKSGGRLSELEAHVKYAEDCANPQTRKAKDLGELKNPGGYLVKKTTEALVRRHLRWPKFPKKEDAPNNRG